jgi:hypothetical protein
MIRTLICAFLLALVAACGGEAANDGEACAVSVPATGTVPCAQLRTHPPPVDCRGHPEACA